MAAIGRFRPAERLLDLFDHEMLLQLSGDTLVPARLPSCLADPAFAVMYDANAFDDPRRSVMRPSPTLSRVVVRVGTGGTGTGVLSPSELLTTLKGPAGDGKSDPSPAW